MSLDPRDIFLKGSHVCLKSLTTSDISNSNWYGWFNDEVLCNTLQKHYFPSSCESQTQFFNKHLSNSSTKLQLGICLPEKSSISGIVSLNDINYINRNAEFSIVIGDKDAQNVIVFTEASRLIFNHAFNSLNLYRIYGGTISEDLVLLMCRILGCTQEGVLRDSIYKNGEYHNAFLYGVLKHEFTNHFNANQ